MLRQERALKVLEEKDSRFANGDLEANYDQKWEEVGPKADGP